MLDDRYSGRLGQSITAWPSSFGPIANYSTAFGKNGIFQLFKPTRMMHEGSRQGFVGALSKSTTLQLIHKAKLRNPYDRYTTKGCKSSMMIGNLPFNGCQNERKTDQLTGLITAMCLSCRQPPLYSADNASAGRQKIYTIEQAATQE